MTCLHKDLLLYRCDQFSYVQWPCSAHTCHRYLLLLLDLCLASCYTTRSCVPAQDSQSPSLKSLWGYSAYKEHSTHSIGREEETAEHHGVERVEEKGASVRLNIRGKGVSDWLISCSANCANAPSTIVAFRHGSGTGADSMELGSRDR
jgi:hypothetical protein